MESHWRVTASDALQLSIYENGFLFSTFDNIMNTSLCFGRASHLTNCCKRAIGDMRKPICKSSLGRINGISGVKE